MSGFKQDTIELRRRVDGEHSPQGEYDVRESNADARDDAGTCWSGNLCETLGSQTASIADLNVSCANHGQTCAVWAVHNS